MIQHIVEGIIPRCDDAEHAIGKVLDIGGLVHHHGPCWSVVGLQPALSVGIDTADLLASRHHLPKEGVDLWLAAIPRADPADLLLVQHDVPLDRAHHESALGKRRLGPGLLRLGGPRAQAVHVLHVWKGGQGWRGGCGEKGGGGGVGVGFRGADRCAEGRGGVCANKWASAAGSCRTSAAGSYRAVKRERINGSIHGSLEKGATAIVSE